MINNDYQANQNNLTYKWIESLAIDEINMDETGVVNLDEHLDPRFALEESSIEFMNRLREFFELYVMKFNELRGQDSQATIKIFKISNTINDFMLFRNSLRLILSRKSNDTVTIHFMTSGKDVYSSRLVKGDSTYPETHHEIKAHIGPFNNIRWIFMGEEVEVQPLVRHYLSEFIKNSAR